MRFEAIVVGEDYAMHTGLRVKILGLTCKETMLGTTHIIYYHVHGEPEDSVDSCISADRIDHIWEEEEEEYEDIGVDVHNDKYGILRNGRRLSLSEVRSHIDFQGFIYDALDGLRTDSCYINRRCEKLIPDYVRLAK